MEAELADFTKFEKARLIGSRALQIAMGAPILIKMDDGDLKRIRYNPVEIAKMEFKENVLPITVRRPLPIKDKEEKVMS